METKGKAVGRGIVIMLLYFLIRSWDSVTSPSFLSRGVRSPYPCGEGTVRILENESDPILASTVTSQMTYGSNTQTHARTTPAL
jgi:hypothetical protein